MSITWCLTYDISTEVTIFWTDNVAKLGSDFSENKIFDKQNKTVINLYRKNYHIWKIWRMVRHKAPANVAKLSRIDSILHGM